MSIGYACEKLTKAVRGMAASPDTIQQRIADAYNFNLINIKPDKDLPNDTRWIYEEISTQLTSAEPVGDEGRVQATVASMSDEDAANIAYKIVRLCDEVCARNRDLRVPML